MALASGWWRMSYAWTADREEVIALRRDGIVQRHEVATSTTQVVAQLPVWSNTQARTGALLTLEDGTHRLGMFAVSSLGVLDRDILRLEPIEDEGGISALASLLDGRIVFASNEPGNIHVETPEGFTRVSAGGPRIDLLIPAKDFLLVVRDTGTVNVLRLPSFEPACGESLGTIIRGVGSHVVLERDENGAPTKMLVGHVNRRAGPGFIEVVELGWP